MRVKLFHMRSFYRFNIFFAIWNVEENSTTFPLVGSAGCDHSSKSIMTVYESGLAQS